MMLAEDCSDGIVKSFYLGRIESAVLTGERYTIPKDFDPDSFFRDTFGLFVGGGKPFRFRVRFSREASDEVRELNYHPRQKIETARGGEAILELPARSVKEARRFILPYGKEAVALSPEELVHDMRNELQAMADSYDRKARGARRKAKRSAHA